MATFSVATVSSRGFWIWANAHLQSGGLQSQGLQARRTTDFESVPKKTIVWGLQSVGYNLMGYNHEPLSWDLNQHSFVWVATVSVATISSHGFGIWQNIHLSERRIILFREQASKHRNAAGLTCRVLLQRSRNQSPLQGSARQHDGETSGKPMLLSSFSR